MDSGSECSGSALESVKDNDEETLEIPHGAGDISKLENTELSSGKENQISCSAQIVDSETRDADLVVKNDGESAILAANSPNSTTWPPGVPCESPPPLPASVSKGFGLKKWKRIRRCCSKDSNHDVDNNMILKRVLPSSERYDPSVDANQTSEGSFGSVNMLARNSLLDSPPAIGSGFCMGCLAAENCEDQISKSSTPACVPKLRYDLPATSGNPREKNRMKNFNGKVMGNSMQRVQRENGWIETRKKPRGNRTGIDKENSHSSLESDSRSPSLVFLQGASSSAVSNGKHIGTSTHQDGEASEEERQTCYCSNNTGRASACPSWNGKEEGDVNDEQLADQDPLDESVILLQSAQEALQKEVMKLGEIGKESFSSCHANLNGSSSTCESSSSDQQHSKGVRSVPHEERVRLLEGELKEASAALKEERSRVVELEAALNSGTPVGECESIESEVDAIFKQRMGAEIEYFAVTQKLRAAAEEDMRKLREAETMIGALMKRIEGSGLIDLGGEEVGRLEKKAWRVGLCLFLQLVFLLAVIFSVLVLRFQAPPAGAVPT